MHIKLKKNKNIFYALNCALLLSSMILILSCSTDNNISELKPYLRKSLVWHNDTLGVDIPLEVYFLEETTDSTEAQVIVYVKNYGEKRIGQEDDLSILRDFITDRFIVITLDFENNPEAVSPRFDSDLYEIFRAVYGEKRRSILADINLTPKKYRCFFLPAGYRLATDLVFWEIDKHGSFGTLERIRKTYNDEVVLGPKKVAGKKLAASPGEMTGINGEPFDYKLRMDIVYPSQANKKVPLVFNISTQPIRHPNSRPRAFRPHFIGFSMRGYAFAIIDHCYNPVRRHYWYFGRYSLDGWNGLKSYTAAIRYIRAHSDNYSIDSRYIGGWGHSKGSYAITRLSDPDHAGQNEHSKFRDQPDGTPEPQPWPGYSSQITAGYQSMGNGTRRTQYVTENYVPTIIACGENDQYNHWAVWPKLVAAYEKQDANHLAIGMLGMGHELPYGFDEDWKVDRYLLVHEFFDQYLKVEEKLAPKVLVVTVPDKKGDSDNISLHFAPVMDVKSVTDGNGVKIIRFQDNKQVSGKWEILRNGTFFNFTPDEKFSENENYRVVITTKVKNERGIGLKKEKVVEFTVAKTGN